MHYHYQSPTTFNKYFPELSMATKETPYVVEPPQYLLATPFSTSHWISKILHANLSGKSGSPSELKCFFDVKNITCLARIPPTLRFNHILRPEREGNEESHKSHNSGLASEEGKGHWNDMHKFLLAGAVSTVISRTCVAPLERIKLECIVQGSKRSWVKIVRCIWAAEGLRGFWKGNSLNLLRMVPFKSINFICYDTYLDWLLNSQGKKEITNHDRLVGGGISGVLATVLCIPLDTVSFLSLYKGLAAALISMGPASAVFYTVYDILKTSHLSNSKKKKKRANVVARTELGPAWTLAYAAIAGACSETVTYPLEVIRRQLQLQQSTNLGLASAFIHLVKRGGAESLFAGLVPSTLQVLMLLPL
ncbi:hypothetical protein GW17_00027339 [Ensete ventricosum]|nr:hypothetical protein GW17_00027339 [Ensete ventricosum]